MKYLFSVILVGCFSFQGWAADSFYKNAVIMFTIPDGWRLYEEKINTREGFVGIEKIRKDTDFTATVNISWFNDESSELLMSLEEEAQKNKKKTQYGRYPAYGNTQIKPILTVPHESSDYTIFSKHHSIYIRTKAPITSAENSQEGFDKIANSLRIYQGQVEWIYVQ